MSCNSPLQRYLVFVKVSSGSFLKPEQAFVANGFYPITQVIEVEGLSEGAYGEVALREQGKEYSIANDIRKLPSLALKVKQDLDTKTLIVHDMFQYWWANQKTIQCDIAVWITSRNWVPLEKYTFYGCSFLENTKAPMSMGTPAIGVRSFRFAPYDVEYESLYTAALSLVCSR